MVQFHVLDLIFSLICHFTWPILIFKAFTDLRSVTIKRNVQRVLIFCSYLASILKKTVWHYLYFSIDAVKLLWSFNSLLPFCNSVHELPSFPDQLIVANQWQTNCSHFPVYHPHLTCHSTMSTQGPHSAELRARLIWIIHTLMNFGYSKNVLHFQGPVRESGISCPWILGQNW